jgi:hypothetical protein
MNKDGQSQYDEMFAKVQSGEITQEVWFEFCLELLVELINSK